MPRAFCEMLRCESLSRVSASSFSFVQSAATHALPPARAAAPSRSELDGAARPAPVQWFYFELFSQKVNTKKYVFVGLMRPKHNERFFFSPQIILDGVQFWGRPRKLVSTAAHFLFVRPRATRALSWSNAPLHQSIILKINFNSNTTCFFWETSGEEFCSCVFARVVQRWLTSGLCFILEPSPLSIGQISIKSLTPAFITMPSLALMLRPKPATCLFGFFFFFCVCTCWQKLTPATVCVLFVRVNGWSCTVEKSSRTIIPSPLAVGCWEAVSRSFSVCLLTPTKVSIDEFVLFVFVFVFF